MNQRDDTTNCAELPENSTGTIDLHGCTPGTREFFHDCLNLPVIVSVNESDLSLIECSALRRIAVTSRERITINLEKAQHRELQAIAKEYKVSISWIGQAAIARLLEQYKKHEFQLPLDLDQRSGT